MFPDKERAREFAEQLSEQAERQPNEVRREREAVNDAVAEEFAKAGHPVGVIKHPWEHTSEEHEEAQQLVDVAFQEDLNAALKRARVNKNYPRILDLFHDVLTGEMYDLLTQHQLNRQPLITAVLFIISVFIVLLLALLAFTLLI